MRHAITAVLATAMLGFAGLANADEIKGTVAAIDGQARVLVLDDGNQYAVQEGVQIEGLEPGTEVTVMFQDDGGKRVATSVTPAQ